MNTLKVMGEAPKARRRHSACFLGSSMLIFGGFNGEYFNDLHYVNMNGNKRKPIFDNEITVKTVSSLANIKGVTQEWITTS